MILRHAGWNPDSMPWMELAASDVELIAEELVRFHEQFHGCFRRKEQHRLGLAYLSGLLSNKEAKSAEPIALTFLDENGVRPLQQFLKSHRWDDGAMLGMHHVLLADAISSPEGMLTVDSSEFAKKGKESVGVARQYCGALGKVDNCQSGIFVGYSSRRAMVFWPADCTCRSAGSPRSTRTGARSTWFPKRVSFRQSPRSPQSSSTPWTRRSSFPPNGSAVMPPSDPTGTSLRPCPKINTILPA